MFCDLFVICFVFFCMNGYASQLCVCRYASQVVCMDTRPELCVWIRVPSCVYIRVPTSCTDTRPKLTSRYASRMSYLLRYVTSVHAHAHTMYTCIRVPTSCVYTRPNFVYGYASQVVCMDTRPNFVYGYASQLECFVWFLCEFYGILWNSMVFCVNSMNSCLFFCFV